MSDPRFARLRTDPRFRKPKKGQAKVVVDERFKSIFQDDKKGKKGRSKDRRVDKYGRSVSDSLDKDNLKRFYRLDADEGDAVGTAPRPDYARGEGLPESSSEDEADESAEAQESDKVDEGDVVLSRHVSKPKAVLDLEDLEVDLNEDDDVIAELNAQAAAYNKQHTEEQSTSPEIAPTCRIACVNLDWDHVRAAHLYKILSSLVSVTGSAPSGNVVRGNVLNVRVYPSEFGKARMKLEDVEGPPKEIFQKPRGEDGKRSIIQEDDGNDYDDDALRKYHVDRLRYYYAIVTCDSSDTASHIVRELDGNELERTANVFDLSFVPEEMTFDDEFRDEATSAVELDKSLFKGLDFSTDALRHSKVKLRWDDDDGERDKVTRRTLSRKEIEEADFKAYIASSSSDSSEGEGSKSKQTKKRGSKNERDKLRNLLLSGNDDQGMEGFDGDAFGADDREGDLEITFMPGLSTTKANSEEETTLEKYKRKQKEKKKQKTDAKQKKDGGIEKNDRDDFFGDDGSEAEGSEPERQTEATREELELVAAPDEGSAMIQHFDMKAIVKADKQKKGKKFKKGRRRKDDDDGKEDLQEDFELDASDARFKAVHEDPSFAIDLSNPHFKKTKGMSTILTERTKRQQDSSALQGRTASKDSAGKHESQSLSKLVESVKRKSAQHDGKGLGKRRKL